MTYLSVQERLRIEAEFQAMNRAQRTGETCIVYHMPDWSKAWVRTEAEGRDGIPSQALVWSKYKGGE